MPEDVMSLVVPAVLIGIIGLIVGAIAGYLLGGMQEPEPQEPKRPKNLVEITRLWWDKRSGRIAVEMDGKVAAAPVDLTTRQREMLQKSMEELRTWLGISEAAARAVPGTASTAASTAGSSQSSAQTVSVPPPPPIPPTLKVAPRRAAAAEDLPFSMEPPVKPVPVDLLNAILPRTSADKVKEPARSIATQVDEIVQERLPNSPFRDRLIRVQDSPHIGIQVVIDMQTFEGIGDVPDPAIQSFLRDCVAEWERRSGA